MKSKQSPLDESGPQMFWKIKLTLACAVLGAIIAFYLVRVF